MPREGVVEGVAEAGAVAVEVEVAVAERVTRLGVGVGREVVVGREVGVPPRGGERVGGGVGAELPVAPVLSVAALGLEVWEGVGREDGVEAGTPPPPPVPVILGVAVGKGEGMVVVREEGEVVGVPPW